METPTIEKKKLKVTRRYPASPERVFAAWTNADQLARWFAPNDEMTVVVDDDFSPKAGGTYRIEMRHQAGNVYTVAGKFVEVSKPNKIVFTWKWENEEMAGLPETIVAVTLSAIDGGTELTLTHDGFPNEEAAGSHLAGWNGCTWRLERLFASSTLHHDSVMLALNRKLWTNALDGISDDELKARSSDRNNNLMWLATHVAHNRAFIARMLGSNIESSFDAFNKSVDDIKSYPTIDEVREFYGKATGEILKLLPQVTNDHLDGPPPFQFPIADTTLGGALAFMVQHEAYHIGQMGFARRSLGHDATSYS